MLNVLSNADTVQFEPIDTGNAADERFLRLLGPTLRHNVEHPTAFRPEELPAQRHHRRGRDCNQQSVEGLTHRPLTTTRFGIEVCCCGAIRQLVDGRPDSRWTDINAALDDPQWFTRADKYATSTNASSLFIARS